MFPADTFPSGSSPPHGSPPHIEFRTAAPGRFSCPYCCKAAPVRHLLNVSGDLFSFFPRYSSFFAGSFSRRFISPFLLILTVRLLSLKAPFLIHGRLRKFILPTFLILNRRRDIPCLSFRQPSPPACMSSICVTVVTTFS